MNNTFVHKICPVVDLGSLKEGLEENIELIQ